MPHYKSHNVRIFNVANISSGLTRHILRSRCSTTVNGCETKLDRLINVKATASDFISQN